SELIEYLAPRVPALIPTDRLLKFSRRPGAILRLLRKRKDPIRDTVWRRRTRSCDPNEAFRRLLTSHWLFRAAAPVERQPTPDKMARTTFSSSPFTQTGDSAAQEAGAPSKGIPRSACLSSPCWWPRCLPRWSWQQQPPHIEVGAIQATRVRVTTTAIPGTGCTARRMRTSGS